MIKQDFVRYNVEAAEELGILDVRRAEDGAPQSWKLVYSQEQLNAIVSSNLPLIRRKDAVLGPAYIGWTTPDVYLAIKMYESTDSVAGLTLKEFLCNVFSSK